MKKLILNLIALILCVMCLPLAACQELEKPTTPTTPNPEPEKVSITTNINNGVLMIDSEKELDSYKIYLGKDMFCTINTDSVDLARAIMDEYDYACFGDWKVKVVGILNGKEVGESDALTFSIKELKSDNFCSALNSDYSATDYFVMSENIFIYGAGLYNTKEPPEDIFHKYTFSSNRDIDQNTLFFIARPFTATIDGNGYTFNVVVDEPIFWVGLPFVFGGVFGEVSDGAVIKNMHAYLDFKYEARNRATASASFIFGHKGTIENSFIDQISRPFVRELLENDNGRYKDDAKHLDKDDQRVAIVSHAESSARIIKTILSLHVYDLAGDKKECGGAVLYSNEGAYYEDCVFVSDLEQATFFNTETGAAIGTPISEGVYFYKDLYDLIDGDGFRSEGALSRFSKFVEFDGDVIKELGNAFSIVDEELYFLNRQIEII